MNTVQLPSDAHIKQAQADAEKAIKTYRRNAIKVVVITGTFIAGHFLVKELEKRGY